MRETKYHTITDIVSVVYCEQKLVYDRTRGKATPFDIQVKAAHGRFEHARFQVEGYSQLARNPIRLFAHMLSSRRYRARLQQKRDARCFIATHVYGPHAPETDFLRAWRDRALLPSPIGRLLVHCYYAVSPRLLPLLVRSLRLTSWMRFALDRLLIRLGMRR